jgi:glycosyltransferase involved in cell wall biosynthesis
MPDPLSVAHVVLSLDLGGLERVVLDLIRQSEALGQVPSVICVDRRGQLAETAEALGAWVISLDKGPGLKLRAMGSFDRVLRDLRPDVIHSHQIGALFYAGPVARKWGIPVVHTEHGKHFPGSLKHNWLGRIAGTFANRFLCVSNEIADLIVRTGVARRSRVGFQANGIDVRSFRPIPPDERPALRNSLGLPTGGVVIGTAGRLAEIKRYDRLISSFAALKANTPELSLVFVGDGPLKAELEAQAASLGLAGTVFFAGYQSDPRPYLQAMDVFALTSRSEGMPLSVLEAWASELPVVVPNVGGLPDMVADGETGLLVDASDEPSLVAAFRRLIEDPALGRRLGEQGRELALASYDVKAMAEAYDREYRGVLGHVGVAT